MSINGYRGHRDLVVDKNRLGETAICNGNACEPTPLERAASSAPVQARSGDDQMRTSSSASLSAPASGPP